MEKEMATQELQCSCLENPRDGGAWWAADYGTAQSRTRLKWLSSSSSSSREQQGFADSMSLCSMTLVWEKAVGINECGSNHTGLCCFFIPSPLVWITSHEDNKTVYFSFLLLFFFFFNCDSPPMIDENEGSRVKLSNPEAWSPFICDLGLIIHCF